MRPSAAILFMTFSVGCASELSPPQDLSALHYEVAIDPTHLEPGSRYRITHRIANTGGTAAAICLTGDREIRLNGVSVESTTVADTWCQPAFKLSPGGRREWAVESTWSWKCPEYQSDLPALKHLPECDSRLQLTIEIVVCGIPNGYTLPCQHRVKLVSDPVVVMVRNVRERG